MRSFFLLAVLAVLLFLSASSSEARSGAIDKRLEERIELEERAQLEGRGVILPDDCSGCTWPTPPRYDLEWCFCCKACPEHTPACIRNDGFCTLKQRCMDLKLCQDEAIQQMLPQTSSTNAPVIMLEGMVSLTTTTTEAAVVETHAAACAEPDATCTGWNGFCASRLTGCPQGSEIVPQVPCNALDGGFECICCHSIVAKEHIVIESSTTTTAATTSTTTTPATTTTLATTTTPATTTTLATTTTTTSTAATTTASTTTTTTESQTVVEEISEISEEDTTTTTTTSPTTTFSENHGKHHHQEEEEEEQTPQIQDDDDSESSSSSGSSSSGSSSSSDWHRRRPPHGSAHGLTPAGAILIASMIVLCIIFLFCALHLFRRETEQSNKELSEAERGSRATEESQTFETPVPPPQAETPTQSRLPNSSTKNLFLSHMKNKIETNSKAHDE